MPITYRIDAQRRLIVATATGELSDEDLHAYAFAVADDPANAPDVRELFDLRGVSAVAVTADGVRQVAQTVSEIDVAGKPSKLAIVAVSAVAFGLARMYQVLRSDAPRDIQVFDDMNEALAWLGPPAAGPEAEARPS